MGKAALANAHDQILGEALDEPFLYHDPARAGFTSLLTPGGSQRQVTFKLADLPGRLALQRGVQGDAYLAQNEFFKPNRQVVNLWRLTSLYLDLDTYKNEDLRHPPEFLAAMLLDQCIERSIPQPSLVVSSGRGLQVKWLLSTPVPRKALPRWQAVQNELWRRLQHLEADARALDASRVLRLVGTSNSKSGDLVRVLHRATCPTMGGELMPHGVVGYDFELLAETLLPFSRAELAAQTEHRESLQRERAVAAEDEARRRQTRHESSTLVGVGRGCAKRIVPCELAWDRLRDLRLIVEIRGWAEEGAPPGQRDMLVFLASCFLASSRLVRNLGAEARSLAREFAHTWSDGEVRNCVSAALKRAEAAHRGEKVKFQGWPVDPRYRFTNEYLVEVLALTSGEQAQMTTIVGRDESRRRDRERKARLRRAQGAQTRDAYCGKAQAHRARAQILRVAGRSLTEIAELLGISKTSASRYCRA